MPQLTVLETDLARFIELDISQRTVFLPSCVYRKEGYGLAPSIKGWTITMQLVRKRSSLASEADQNTADMARDDADLVENARQNPKAFDALYERYHPAIYVYCFRRLGTPESADDATSIIFMKAFTALPRFRPDRARSGFTFRSWIFSIAHNVVIDAWRGDRRHISLDGASGELIAPHLVDSSGTPEDAALGAEEAQKVMALLAQLPERQRAAVELRLAGLSTSEVAHTLGMSIPATKSLQFRGYQTLRNLLRSNPRAITREIL